MYKFLTIFFLICTISKNFGQKNIDSVLTQIELSKSDTEKVNRYLKLIVDLGSINTEKAIEVAQENLALSKKINFKLAKSYQELAHSFFLHSDFKNSLISYQFAETESNKIKHEKQKKTLLSDIYGEMASVYLQLQNFKAAINSSKKSLESSRELGKPELVVISEYNLGNIFFTIKDYENALKQFYKAERGFIQSRDSFYLTYVYNSIGACLHDKKDYKNALQYFLLAYDLTEKFTPDDKPTIAIALQNIGETYGNIGDYEKCKTYCSEAQGLFQELNDKNNLSIAYYNLANAHSKLGEFEKSSEFYQKYVQLKDSIFNEDTKNTIHEMSVKYETEKKEKENQVLTLENKNKKQVISFALGGCVLLLGLVFFIFNGYRNKKKANQLLEEKNTIINEQKTIVEEQHQDITDSIKYAKRIQGAILPPRNFWNKILPSSFVLYMPKDVLSGDFYWIEETKDYIYVAAADCTGHGVPGALISIVNFNLLNKAVLEQNLVTPSEILDAVNIWLTDSLHQSYRENAVRDGMDVTLIAIHKHSNEVLFAGANNPIYVVSDGKLNVIKGDKFPVGAFMEDKIQKFTTKSFTVNKGDSIYLFSDGFADQFGGDSGKKYKYAPFQQKLISISGLPVTNQRSSMKEEFLKWKGKHEQVDDVLLVGIKIV